MRGSGRSESVPWTSRTSGPPSGPVTPVTSKEAPPLSRPPTLTWLRVAGSLPSPRAEIVTREASSTKLGCVVRSTKRTKPSSTWTVPTSTRTPVSAEGV